MCCQFADGCRRAPAQARLGTVMRPVRPVLCPKRCAALIAGAFCRTFFGFALSSLTFGVGLGFAQQEPTLHQRDYENGDRYVGTMRNGMRHGQGRYEWHHGHVYEGAYENDLPQGRGIYTWPSGAQYRGEFQQGLRHGQGRFAWGPGNYYQGEYRMGERTGVGVRVRGGKTVYEGGFLDGVRHGEGAQIEESGDLFSGWYEDGLRQGAGVRKKKNGSLWLEFWQKGVRTGSRRIERVRQCALFVEGQEWMFEGDGCIDGKAHGPGVAVSLQGDQVAENANAVLGFLRPLRVRRLYVPNWTSG